MQPFDDFSLQLFGTEEITRVNIFSCGHVVPEESLCPIIMTKGPSGKDLLFNYSNRCSAELVSKMLKCYFILIFFVILLSHTYKYKNIRTVSMNVCEIK